MSLTVSGYTAPRAADFLTEIRARVVQELDDAGLSTDIDWDRDVVWGILTAIMADLLGEVAQPTQAIYAAMDPNNASGIQLDGLGAIVGVGRNQATRGAVSLTLTNALASSIIVPAGSLAEGGGDDGRARWQLRADTTIPASSSVAAIFDCTELGAITAGAGTITTIVTAVTGWSAVNNLAAAEAGEDLETDAEYRLRRQQSLQQTGGRSLNALRADLLGLDAVTGAAVVDNTTASTATYEGLTLAPHSVTAVVYPSTLTGDDEVEVATAIYNQVAAGIYTNGAETATVAGADGFPKVVRWEYATSVDVDIAVVTTLDTGYTVGGVTSEIEAAIAAYMDTLSVGDDVRLLKVLAAIDDVDGVLGAAVTIEGVAADYSILISEIAALDVVSVS